MAIETREQWLAERRKGLGGSDIAAVLGLHPWRTPMDVYYDKLGLHPDPIDDDDPPEPVRWGNLLEPIVAAEVQRRTGIEVLQPLALSYVNDDEPWMRVSPDRLLAPGGWELDPRAEAGVLECKTTSVWQAREWRDGETPTAALVQVLWAFAVLGTDWGMAAGLIGGQRLEIRDVKRDPDLERTIVQRAGEFWHEHVLTQTPPPAVASDRRLLKQLHPSGGLGEVVASEEIRSVAREYDGARRAMKRAKLRRDEAEARLRQLLADHDVALDDDDRPVVKLSFIEPVTVKEHTRPASRRLYVPNMTDDEDAA